MEWDVGIPSCTKCLPPNFDFLFICLFILFERKGKTQVFHLPVHSPHAHHSRVWVRLKLRARIQSYFSARVAEIHVLVPSTTYCPSFRVCISKILGAGAKLQLGPGTSARDMAIPSGGLCGRLNAHLQTSSCNFSAEKYLTIISIVQVCTCHRNGTTFTYHHNFSTKDSI